MENIQKKERILAIDALRGFAVMGIILLHNIEHFNFYSFPETTSPVLGALDKSLWDMLFFMFSGKAYAIFCLVCLVLRSICRAGVRKKEGKILRTAICGACCYC